MTDEAFHLALGVLFGLLGHFFFFLIVIDVNPEGEGRDTNYKTRGSLNMRFQYTIQSL